MVAIETLQFIRLKKNNSSGHQIFPGYIGPGFEQQQIILEAFPEQPETGSKMKGIEFAFI